MKRLEILDSTLRDGAQAEGVAYSVEDKLNIVRALDGLGIALIEAGNPVSNIKETEFFSRVGALRLENSTLTAFGATRRKDTRADEDQNCAALLAAGTPVVTVVGKSSAEQVADILGTSRGENLLMIEETCRLLSGRGRQVIFDAEHFFDGFARDRDYALETLRAALRGGASRIVLCDTNGGGFPRDIADTTASVCREFPDAVVGIHAHNDGGMAAASSVMAVESGAAHVQGTLLGFGERCGNACLAGVIPNLQLKLGIECIPPESLPRLTATAMRVAEITNITLHKDTPFVGRSAFAHKAGMHADAVLKRSASFEHVDPESVGNRRRLLMSEMTGKAAVLSRINKLYPDIDRSSPVVAQILDTMMKKEYEGYQYEGADSSFELIIRRAVEGYEPFFDLISYKVLDELPYDNNRSATATLKLTVGGKLKISASDGDGPVNALDIALREALSEFYPCLSHVRLLDYKVRVMEPRHATAASVRVLITSGDGSEMWTTVGVSKDIIEASWTALVDSIEHKLIKGR